MTGKEFIDKYDSKHRFTEGELREIVAYEELDDAEFIEEIEGEDRRWSRTNEVFYKIGERYFRFTYEQGLTECQPNEYSYQPKEVVLNEYEKTITVREWNTIKR